MLYLSYWIVNNINTECVLFRVIETFGKNTLFILVTHMFLVEVIRLLDYKFFKNFLPKLGIAEGFVFGAIVCIAEFIMISVYYRYKRKIFKVCD